MVAAALLVTDEQRVDLARMAASSVLPHRQVVQAKALLWAADGVANEEIARRVQVDPDTVRAWRKRFAEKGTEGVGKVAKGRGRKPWLPPDTVERVLELTRNGKPPGGATHWSTRSLAAVAGVSKDTVGRIWDDHGLKPWRVDTFKISSDPDFEAKLVDVVALYLNPPARAVVFCFDEKTQCQALDRTQPSLPMKRGRAGTMTHDYKRNGTTTLFAALDVLTGAVIAQCLPRHRHTEFLKFLNTIDREVPKGLQVHLILDNYSTHKHTEVQRWLRRHKRFHLHFTPTSPSWLNLGERWFRELTDKALRRGSFNSVPALITAIEDDLDAHNDDPKPFVWTATAESILEKVRRGRIALQAVSQ